MNLNPWVKGQFFPLLLLFSIICGGLFGVYFNAYVHYLKPFGDVFLNLIFTTIVPLIFFSVSSAIARTQSMAKMGKIFFWMLFVFIITGLIAATFTLILVKIFPLGQGLKMPLAQLNNASANASPVTTQWADIFTVSDFSLLLSHQKILALIVFSILIGFAVLSLKDTKKELVSFLSLGEALFMRLFGFIMYYAPIGFFAYFAVLVANLGPELVENYVYISVLYYVFGLLYFVFVYTAYAYFSGGKAAVMRFWKQVFLPMITAFATCSSAASIPANLMAAKKMQISAEISETVIPLGSMIHKDGSTIGGMIKIAFLFGIFHWDFSGSAILGTALLVALLVGTVMGAIPSGGMLGELLILSVYGFPASALMIIAAISIIIDPLATMLNVTGNTVAAMLIERFVEKRPPS